MLEFPGPRASAIGYHRCYVIRQIGGKWLRKVDRPAAAGGWQLIRRRRKYQAAKPQGLANALGTTRSTWMAVDSSKAQIFGDVAH